MSLEPFAPPDERSTDSGLSPAVVAGAWAMAGAAFGTALGAVLKSSGVIDTLVPVGLGGALFAGIVGSILFKYERASAATRPAMVDARGRVFRPVAAWVLGLPITAGGLGFLLLVILAALKTGSLVLAALCVGVIFAMGAVARPILGSRALHSAVLAIESGQPEEARKRLEAIDRAIWAPEPVRRMAAVNLGLLSLSEGDLDDAAEWYLHAGAGRSRALASTGLALVRVLQDRLEEAEQLLAGAAVGAEGRSAQAELDGVRLLLTLRRDGPDEARKFGERIAGPGAGGLFLAVLAAARWKAGDRTGAQALMRDHAVDDTLQSGFGQVIPELQELRAGMFDAGVS